MGLARTTFSPKRRECEDGGRQRERGYSLGYFLEDGNFGSEWGSGALKRRLTSAGSEEERGSGGEDGGGDNSVPLRRPAHRVEASSRGMVL